MRDALDVFSNRREFFRRYAFIVQWFSEINVYVARLKTPMKRVSSKKCSVSRFICVRVYEASDVEHCAHFCLQI